MKRILQLFVIFFVEILWSQVDYSNKGDDFYSYLNVKDFIKIEDKIFSKADNSFFYFDVSTYETQKIYSVNGQLDETTINIDHGSGKVYLANEKGIVVYNSDVVGYGECLPQVYAHLNPSTMNNEIITIDTRKGLYLPNGTNLKIQDTTGSLVNETIIKVQR